MQYHLTFWKATGAGNDFVLIDNRSLTFDGDPAQLARTLCSRHFGIGADGLILLEPSNRADFLMRYYNADGSSGGMCGNGGRCAARLAFQLGVVGKVMKIEALDFVYSAEILEERVRLSMKDPSGIRLRKEVHLRDMSRSVCCLDTGAPHVVMLSNSLESVDVERLGSEIRYHSAFAPQGANANFVRVTGASSITLRTYERGVESETLACGTGAVASAIAAYLLHKVRPPVAVHVRSGELLEVDFRHEGNYITSVSLKGNARILFSGKILYRSDETSSSIVEPDPFHPQ